MAVYLKGALRVIFFSAVDIVTAPYSTVNPLVSRWTCRGLRPVGTYNALIVPQTSLWRAE